MCAAIRNRKRQWQLTLVLLPGKSHGWRSLVGCSPWGCEESDTTEWLHFHFSLSCIGEGNGNPLQCSCLENPRDGGAWCVAVYRVAQSRTRLKRLSSSSSSNQKLETWGLPRQEYWGGLLFSTLRNLPNPGMNPCVWCLLDWQADSLPLCHLGSPIVTYCCCCCC